MAATDRVDVCVCHFFTGIEVDFGETIRLKLGGSRKAFESRAHEAILFFDPVAGEWRGRAR
jgi:hypothetical protein